MAEILKCMIEFGLLDSKRTALRPAVSDRATVKEYTEVNGTAKCTGKDDREILTSLGCPVHYYLPGLEDVYKFSSIAPVHGSGIGISAAGFVCAWAQGLFWRLSACRIEAVVFPLWMRIILIARSVVICIFRTDFGRFPWSAERSGWGD